MPARIYEESERLSQRWPASLLEAIDDAAHARGWNTTQWLQEAARNELRRQERRQARETTKASLPRSLRGGPNI